MAANDWRTEPTPSTRRPGQLQQPTGRAERREFTIIRYFDAATVGMTAADTFKICTIGAGVMVNGVWVVIATAEGATATIDIGDTASATGYSNDLDINSTSHTVTAATTQVKYYSAADYLVLLVNNTLDAAKFYVVVRCTRLV